MLQRLKDILVPHEGNNFRPDILEQFSMGVMLVLILLSFAMANLQALLWISSDWLVSTVLPAVIVELTNDERDTEALGTLVRNPVLDAAAQLKADDMAKNSYFAHYSPSGVSPWYWFEKAGYDYLHAGENLAVHFTESDEVVEAWMKSPSHRANIMNDAYREIGVGTAKGEYKGQPTIFVVQLFGTKRISEEQAPSTVAGATTGGESAQITIEEVREEETPRDVAPATVDVVEITPREEIPEDTVSEDIPPVEEEMEEMLPPVVITELATTSRDGEPIAAPVTPDDGELSDTVSLPLTSATAPSIWLEVLYAVLALLVVGVLLVSIAIEWRRHHPVQIAYAGGLLATMALLFYIHTALTGSVMII